MARHDETPPAAPLKGGHCLVVTGTPDESSRRHVRGEIRRVNEERSEWFARSPAPERRPAALDVYVTDAGGELIAGLLATERFWWTGRGGPEVRDEAQRSNAAGERARPGRAAPRGSGRGLLQQGVHLAGDGRGDVGDGGLVRPEVV